MKKLRKLLTAVLVCCLMMANVVYAAEGNSKATEPAISYKTHVQNVGWQDYVSNGAVSGTSARSLRLEGIQIKVANKPVSGGIEYRTHVQNIGWQNFVTEDRMSGTSGKSLRLEAIQIKLTGELAKKYDVYYSVHAQNFGWLGWAKNGESAGTAGYSYRLEAIKIKLVKKGGQAPGSTANAFHQRPTDVNYRTHVQNVGWQSWKSNGAMSGTSGKSLRLEGIQMTLSNKETTGSIEYQTHVQNIGWQGWRKDGNMSGTSGRSLRLEAIQIRLTGNMAAKYDIYYRVHAQNFGWMGWAKNGESAGTAGYSYRLEGIETRLVRKGGLAPGSTKNPFASKTPVHKHAYTAKVTKAATCTAEGVKTFTCSCGNSYTERIAKVGHTSSDWKITQNATCTTAGSKHKVCTVCGAELEKTTIPATGVHNNQWVVTGNTRTMKCTVCGAATGKTETNYDGVWGYYDDEAASQLLALINNARYNAQTIKRDPAGNIIEVIEHTPPVSESSDLKAIAKQKAINNSIGSNECINKINNEATSVVSNWFRDDRSRDVMLHIKYSQGGTACFMKSNNNGTYTPIWVLVMN